MTDHESSPRWIIVRLLNAFAVAIWGYPGVRPPLGSEKGLIIMLYTLSEPPKLDKSPKSWDLLPDRRPDRPWHSSQEVGLSRTPYHSVGRPGHSQHSSLYDVRRVGCAQDHLALLSKSDRLTWSWNWRSLCYWHVWNGKKVS